MAVGFYATSSQRAPFVRVTSNMLYTARLARPGHFPEADRVAALLLEEHHLRRAIGDAWLALEKAVDG